jgi:sugar lactone lactonase YvrE
MRQLAVGEFEKIASGIYLEGLAVDYARNAVWYSDVIAGGIHGLLPDGRRVSFDEDRKWTGGIIMNADGSVLSSGQGGIRWNNLDTDRGGWLLTEIDGSAINGINEMVPDGTGGIYFDTIDLDNIVVGQTPRPSSIYRLTATGEAVELADGINLANGLMLSADRKQLYCNDTFVGTWVFDVRPDLTLTNKRMLVEKVDADGMALDAQGNVLITGFRSGFLLCLRPDGTELGRVTTPAGAITQIRFGGPDMRDYYITTVPTDGGDSLKDGVPLSAINSFLYRGRAEVPGMPIQPARFTNLKP